MVDLGDISIMRPLHTALNVKTIVKSPVVTACGQMANDTLGYSGDFNDIWERLGSLPKESCD